ncbi:DegQ family serine endoprotease [Pseudacidovorax sp. RU35E]|uniref:DegQ family serine endoprotease n=1 Tax=Pseudacidovorax sp. RU35E TaxID=1907403 RepID=UPI000953A7D5|nr:DegQ family serine endoprotease [Pseudacidovorax sp. RU35E]SIR28049.1 serine protease Do [Pseudacidovorax sp. RU35E]
MNTQTILQSPKRLVIALAAAGVLGAAAGGAYTSAHALGSAPQPPVVAASPMVAPIAAPDFSVITAQQGPAVVNISVSGMTKTALDTSGDDDDSGSAAMPPGMSPNDPFYQFFRQFGGVPGHRQGPQRSVPTRAEGSGFILSPDGIILTNAHVVDGAKEVTVKLTDRREYRAKVLGADPKTDVAVLKINAKDLPTVKLGSPKDLKVGEWVLAIGSPFGFENSVTAGVVSAKGRSLPDDGFTPFIQTDVPINPGNSGGPLFNARGEVVGINSQIYSRSGGYQGVSFSIPIDIAMRVKDQIVATGHADHAKLGVAVQEVNQAFADSFKLDKPQGALVSNVEKGGPADKAGLKSGDVILKVDGEPITTSGDLPAIIGQKAPGQKAQIEIWRDGGARELTAQLGNAGDKAKVAKAEEAVGKGKLGLALRPLQPQEQKEVGTSGGLLIEDARGPAASAGIQQGDVLLAINGTPAKSVDQVREAVAKADKSVALLIQRGDEKIFVPVNIG